MELTDGIHLVASGWLGLALTDRCDCNAYLVADGDDAVLVDAGCGLGAERTLALIEAAGAPPVSRVLVTHAHADHAAGAAALAAALGAEVWASAHAAAILEAGDADAAGLTDATAAGIYPPGLAYRPTAVAHRLGDESLTVGRLRLDAVRCDGHSAGHLAFLAHHRAGLALFSGDVVFARGRVALLSTPDSDVSALAASVERLAALRPQLLLAGHGAPVLRDAGDHLAVARDAFRRRALPPQLA